MMSNHFDKNTSSVAGGRVYAPRKADKRRASLCALTSSKAGMLMILFGILSLVLAIACPLYMDVTGRAILFDNPQGIDHEAIIEGEKMFSLACFAALGLVLILGGCRTASRSTTLRKDERVFIQGDELVSTFHLSGDAFAGSVNVVVVKLPQSHITYDEKKRCWTLTGAIHGGYFRDSGSNVPLAFDDLEPFERSYEVFDYFGSEFRNLMNLYKSNF